MLAQTLRWRYGATEERFLRFENKSSVHRRLWGKLQHGIMVVRGETYDDVHDNMIRWKDLEQRAGALIRSFFWLGPDREF